MLILHIVMLVLNAVVLFVAAYFVFNAFRHPTTANLLKQSYARIIYYVTLGIVQLIFMYLFLIVSGASKPDSTHQPSELDLEVSNDIRQQHNQQ